MGGQNKKTEKLLEKLNDSLKGKIQSASVLCDEITLEIHPKDLKPTCLLLRDHPNLKFDLLIDVCGVDYLDYGVSEWVTDEATSKGFERGVAKAQPVRVLDWNKPRFAVAYHLLSIELNQRLRLRVFLDETEMLVDSVIDIWPAADWFEREAFDLFGILFEGHPDLRRILTDYGFIGHPFRKDFPLIGKTEVRYDARQRRVVSEPVSIESRVLVPKVIRLDSRYDEMKTEIEDTHG